jgi:hypothetical protein
MPIQGVPRQKLFPPLSICALAARLLGVGSEYEFLAAAKFKNQ